MKFGLMFSNIGPFAQPEGLTHLAQTAENTGIESLWTVEHAAVPVGYQSRYPYSGDGKMPGPENAPIPDPLVWLAYASAVTKTIRLATGILILPQRHPIYTAKELSTLGLLTAIDRAALAAYCEAWGTWIDAVEKVREFGAILKVPSTGFPMQSPYFSVANQAQKQMRAYLTEFGMTPASRSRIEIEPVKEADEFEKWMRKRGKWRS